MAHGLDYLQEMPLDRFCNFIWWMLTKDGQESDRAKLKAKLWKPPVGVAVTDPRSPWSPENERAALSQFKAQVAR